MQRRLGGIEFIKNGCYKKGVVGMTKSMKIEKVDNGYIVETQEWSYHTRVFKEEDELIINIMHFFGIFDYLIEKKPNR